MKNELIDTKTAAQYLGVSQAFLERDRWMGATIPFVRIGRRAIRYKLSTLQQYIADHTSQNTIKVENIND